MNFCKALGAKAPSKKAVVMNTPFGPAILLCNVIHPNQMLAKSDKKHIKRMLDGLPFVSLRNPGGEGFGGELDGFSFSGMLWVSLGSSDMYLPRYLVRQTL